ncbi:MAG: hypothetical protein OHK0023_15700 [Anaerolineae bacterium]
MLVLALTVAAAVSGSFDNSPEARREDEDIGYTLSAKFCIDVIVKISTRNALRLARFEHALG